MRSPATPSRVWHAVLALVVLAALVAQVVLLIGGGRDANSGQATASAATSLVRFVSYFTVQSNLLVLVAAVSLVLDPARDGRFWRVLRLTGLLGITVTGLVFGAVLAPLLHHTGIDWWINAGFHYVSPVMAFLGWAVFGPRPRVDGRTAAWAVAWPIAWVVYTLVRGAVVGWYPYPFLDVDAVGYPIALRNTGFVVVLALVLLAVFRWLDGRLRPVTPAGG
ncbi:Pr6Pr family membrane protein [Kineococcus sp. GCM10028916]|uniref:Pr6Pr family membrane protein n=1 Tax=Kineococcus sp. GCM10028916 TaxID=3273394 RepID=UPI003642A67E